MNGRITNTRIVDAPMLPGRMKQDQTVMRHNKVHYHGGNPGRQTPYPCRPYLRLLPGRYQPVQGVTDNKEGLQSQYESSTVMNSSNGTFLSKNPFSDKPIRCNDGFIKAQMDNLTVCSKSFEQQSYPKKAKHMNCKLVLSSRSQFFHNRRFFSNQAKLRSTTQRFGITLNRCNSLRLAICTSTSLPSAATTPSANGLPV